MISKALWSPKISPRAAEGHGSKRKLQEEAVLGRSCSSGLKTHTRPDLPSRKATESPKSKGLPTKKDLWLESPFWLQEEQSADIWSSEKTSLVSSIKGNSPRKEGKSFYRYWASRSEREIQERKTLPSCKSQKSSETWLKAKRKLVWKQREKEYPAPSSPPKTKTEDCYFEDVAWEYRKGC